MSGVLKESDRQTAGINRGSQQEPPYYLLPAFVPEKATVNQLKSILAERNVPVNFNSRALKDE
ncbi:hypothetical protein BC829DRAFT_158885 [Chytridium lagenaria]|nr:hypothetical protein BC829DRAFT_158885 [Chytridium lagenaria]